MAGKPDIDTSLVETMYRDYLRGLDALEIDRIARDVAARAQQQAAPQGPPGLYQGRVVVTPGVAPTSLRDGDIWPSRSRPPFMEVMNDAGALPEPEPEIRAMNPDTGQTDLTPYGQIMLRFTRIGREELRGKNTHLGERLPGIAHLSACIVAGRAHVFVVTRAGIARHIEDDFRLFPSDGLMVQLHAIVFNEDHSSPVLGGVATR